MEGKARDWAASGAASGRSRAQAPKLCSEGALSAALRAGRTNKDAGECRCGRGYEGRAHVSHPVCSKNAPQHGEVSETTYPDDVAGLEAWYRRYRAAGRHGDRERCKPPLLPHIRALAIGRCSCGPLRLVVVEGGDAAGYHALE